MIKAVLIPVNDDMVEIEIQKKITAIGFGPLIDAEIAEYHVTAYDVREELPRGLQLIHERLLIACDENGFERKLKVNVRASTLSGIQIFGPVVVCLEDDDGLKSLSLVTIEDMLDNLAD